MTIYELQKTLERAANELRDGVDSEIIYHPSTGHVEAVSTGVSAILFSVGEIEV